MCCRKNPPYVGGANGARAELWQRLSLAVAQWKEINNLNDSIIIFYPSWPNYWGHNITGYIHYRSQYVSTGLFTTVYVQVWSQAVTFFSLYTFRIIITFVEKTWTRKKKKSYCFSAAAAGSFDYLFRLMTVKCPTCPQKLINQTMNLTWTFVVAALSLKLKLNCHRSWSMVTLCMNKVLPERKSFISVGYNSLMPAEILKNLQFSTF